MSSAITDPNEVRREAEKQEVEEAIRASAFEATGSREVAEALDISHGRARKPGQELSEENRLGVTRQGGTAKLYQGVEDDEEE